MARKGPTPRPPLDRFAGKIALTDTGCIEWLAGTNGVGYGQFRVQIGGANRHVYAHRWSYEYHVGPIPNGLQLDHLCRNTLCVNPAHLEPVTLQRNVLRGLSSPAQNARKSLCHQGHPLGGENLYVVPSTGYRKCRACARARDLARRPRNRKAA